VRRLLPGRRGVAAIFLGIFALAFTVRVLWILTVQSPLDAVYSDMAGYVDRAEQLLEGRVPPDLRLSTIFPPGAHTLVAAEFWAFGRNARNAIAVVHALVGALAAPFMFLLARQLTPSLLAATLAGVLVAVWYPHVSFGGFFSTEIWFSAAIAVQAWLATHRWKRPPGLLAEGAASAIAFVVRPQFFLTWAMQMGVRGLSFLWRPGKARAFRRIVWVALPMALMMTATSVRFHHLTGRWGLIAQSAGTRLWADTDICQIESTWKLPNGGELHYWFSPPSKPAKKPSDYVKFTGFIVDPDILDAIRLERMRGVSWRDRFLRKVHNVQLLLVENLPWPESNYHDDISVLRLTDGIRRSDLMEFCRDALLYAGLPLCAIGLALGRRNRALFVVATNLLTIVITAAFFFGEARYLIPYQPFILLMDVVGAYELLVRLRRFVARMVRRSSRQPPNGPAVAEISAST
jgi:hypothetical protein